MVVRRRADAADELFDLQDAVIAFDRLRGDAEELRVRALLVADDVAVRFGEEFVAGLAVNTHAELVPHRAGWHVEGFLFAEHRSHAFFESANGRIFTEDVIA